MKLSMALISKYLKDYRQECHILEDAATIKGVRMFSEMQTAYSGEYVYIGKAEGYFQDPRYKEALLLASGKNQILCFGQDYEQLLNDVLSAFDFYGSLEQKLLHLAAEHAPLSEMLQIMDGVIDDPLFVFDIHGQLEADRNREKLQDSRLLTCVQNEYYLSQNVLGFVFVDSEGKISHDLSDFPQRLHQKDTPEIETVSMYLSQSAERIGFLMCFPSDSVGSAVAMAIEPLLSGSLVQAGEFTARNSLLQSSHSILLRLLQQESLDEKVLQIFRRNLSLVGNPILLVFQSLAIRNYTFRYMLMRQIRQCAIPGTTCEFENFVVSVTDESQVKQLLDDLAEELESGQFMAGVSMSVGRMEEIHMAYEQAVFALQTRRQPGVWYCRDVALPYMLATLSEKRMIRNLLHPALGILRQYDEENHTCLYQTLHTYLQTGMRKVQTAEKLFVHLNTLKYRLGRICEICGIDFEKHEDLFYLELSFALQDEVEKKESGEKDELSD